MSTMDLGVRGRSRGAGNGWRAGGHRRSRVLATMVLAMFATVSVDQGLLRILPASAASITVTTTNQEVNTDGDCSLQEAIFAANYNASEAIDPANPSGPHITTGCAAGVGADTIVLAAGAIYQVSGNVINQFSVAGLSVNPDVRSTITIQGNGARIELLGSQNLRAFVVNSGPDEDVADAEPAPAGNLTLKNLHIKGFRAKGGNGTDGGGGGLGAGGAVYVCGGILTVDNSTFEGNTATGGSGAATAGTGGGGGGGGLGGNGGDGPQNGGGGGGGSRGNGGAAGVGGGGGGGTANSGAAGGAVVGGNGGFNCGGKGGDSPSAAGGNGFCRGGGAGGGASGAPNGGVGGIGNYGGGGGGGGAAAAARADSAVEWGQTATVEMAASVAVVAAARVAAVPPGRSQAPPEAAMAAVALVWAVPSSTTAATSRSATARSPVTR